MGSRRGDREPVSRHHGLGADDNLGSVETVGGILYLVRPDGSRVEWGVSKALSDDIDAAMGSKQLGTNPAGNPYV